MFVYLFVSRSKHFYSQRSSTHVMLGLGQAGLGWFAQVFAGLRISTPFHLLELENEVFWLFFIFFLFNESVAFPYNHMRVILQAWPCNLGCCSLSKLIKCPKPVYSSGGAWLLLLSKIILCGLFCLSVQKIMGTFNSDQVTTISEFRE